MLMLVKLQTEDIDNVQCTARQSVYSHSVYSQAW
jgi:hypothetical protein